MAASLCKAFRKYCVLSNPALGILFVLKEVIFCLCPNLCQTKRIGNNLLKDLFIRFRSKHSINTLLSLLRFFMNKSLLSGTKGGNCNEMNQNCQLCPQ